MKRILLSILCLSCAIAAGAQVIYTNGTGGGAWNLPSTWLGGVVPNAANSTSIVVRSGDAVVVPAGYSVQADQLSVNGNGALSIAAGGLLNIVDGLGADLVVNTTADFIVAGVLEFSHGVTFTNVSAANTVVQNGGIYRHKYTSAGAIIGAVWEDGSTVEITGLLGQYGVPTNLNQSFYNFVWNTPGMSQTRTISALRTVRGNFTIQSTGASILHFFGSSSGLVLNVGGNFNVMGSSRIALSQSGKDNTLNIGGSLTYNSSGISTIAQSGTILINVGGNFVHSSGGTLRCAMQSGGVSTFNVTGNVQLNGPLITNFGGVGRIRFVNGTTHQFLGTSRPSGYFQYEVLPGSTLTLVSAPLTGTGTFRLAAGASLNLGSTAGNGTDANGVLQNNTAQGIIRVPPASRNFEAGSTIVYNATTSQQIGSGSHGFASVVISNPTSVTMVNNAQFGSLTVNAGVFNTGVYSALISSNLTIVPVGSISANSNLVLNGTQPQTISANGASLTNLTVNKPSGSVTLTSNLGLSGRLTIQSNTVLNSNGFLTLLSSSPISDGSIGPLLGGSVAGAVNIQRFMSAKGNVNRYISSPIVSAPVSMLQDDFPVTGGFSGSSYPCAGCTTNGASLKYLDPTRVNMPGAQRFVAYPTTSNGQTLQVGRGYAAYMWQNRVVNVDYSGLINSGPIPLPVLYAVSTPFDPTIDGFNLVGNPYPSSIDWNGGSGWARNNISPSAYVPVGNFSLYHNYLDGTGDLTDGIIAMGQAFYVVATGPSPSLTINENAKTGFVGTGFLRDDGSKKQKHKSKQFVVSLEGVDFKTSAFLKLNEAASDDFDPLYDAAKLPVEMNSLAVEDQLGRSLVAHTVTAFDKTIDIPLNVEVLEAGDFVISFADTASGFPLFYLHDRETGIYTEASMANTYAFSVSEAGLQTGRFVLTQNPSFEQPIETSVQVFPNPFNDKLTIRTASDDPASVELINVGGQQILAKEFSKEITIEIGHVIPGVYIARIKTGTGFVTRKLIKK